MHILLGDMTRTPHPAALWPGLRSAHLCLLLTTLLACAGCSRSEEFLIPEAYRGDVFIVTGIPTGEAPQEDWLTNVYRIPPTGILVSTETASPAWHFSRYFYVDEEGGRKALPIVASSIHDTAANRSDETPIVWFPRSGSISGSQLPCSVEFQQFYVGSRAHLSSRDPAVDELRFRDFIREHQEQICP